MNHRIHSPFQAVRAAATPPPAAGAIPRVVRGGLETPLLGDPDLRINAMALVVSWEDSTGQGLLRLRHERREVRFSRQALRRTGSRAPASGDWVLCDAVRSPSGWHAVSIKPIEHHQDRK
jgi:cold shock CspA family protein